MLFSPLEQFDMIYSFFNLFVIDFVFTTIIFLIVLFIFIYGFNKNIKFNFFIKILEQTYGFIIKKQQLSIKYLNKKEVFKASASFFAICLLFPYQREYFVFFETCGFILDFIKPYLFVLYCLVLLSFYSLILISFIYTNKVFLIYYYNLLKNKILTVFFNNKNDSVIIKINEFNSSSESSNTPEPKDPKRDRIKKILYALLGSVVLVSVITGTLIYYNMHPDNAYQYYLVVSSFLGRKISDVQFTSLSLENQQFIQKNNLFGFPKGGSGSLTDTSLLNATSSSSSSINNNLNTTTNSTQQDVLSNNTQNLSTSSSSSSTTSQGEIAPTSTTTYNPKDTSSKVSRTLNYPTNEINDNSSRTIIVNSEKFKEVGPIQNQNNIIKTSAQFLKIARKLHLITDSGVEKKNVQVIINPELFFSELQSKINDRINEKKHLLSEDEILFLKKTLNVEDFLFDLCNYIEFYKESQLPSNFLFLYAYIDELKNKKDLFEVLMNTDPYLKGLLFSIQNNFNLDFLNFCFYIIYQNPVRFNEDLGDIIMTQEYLNNVVNQIFSKDEKGDILRLYIKYLKLHENFSDVLVVTDLRMVLLLDLFLNSCNTPYSVIIKHYFIK